MNDTIPEHGLSAKGAILSALAKAMGEVQKIAKGDRNKHDGYDFASIDDFLALVNPICAANGLIVHMQEAEREDFERKGKFGENAWMRQSFDLTLYHVSGETLPPVRRTVEVLRNGAQAYGSAQSYALKQFWRAILLIPTGDKDDADHQPTDAGTITRRQPQTDRANTKPQPPAHRPDPSRDGPAPADQAIAALMAADSEEALNAIYKGLPAGIRSLPEVIGAGANRKAELRNPAPADDLAGDEIPY
jgi:hypothetical protein